MANPASTKRSLISKANSTIVATTSVAAFVVVFSLVASKTLVSQANYQNRIIGAKKTAVTQLKSNLNARDSLVSSYKAFVGTPQNVLGGNPTGSGEQDGDNAKLVLDALPSQYDFPALATTLEKILSGQSLQILSITGTDESLTQGGSSTSSTSGTSSAASSSSTATTSTSTTSTSSAATSGSAGTQAVAMPFQVQVSGSYDSIKSLINLFDKSIRPFQIQTVELSGGQDNMTATISAQTFYQPSKTFNVSTEVIK